MFSSSGIPQTSSLRGIYSWVADLNEHAPQAQDEYRVWSCLLAHSRFAWWHSSHWPSSQRGTVCTTALSFPLSPVCELLPRAASQLPSASRPYTGVGGPASGLLSWRLALSRLAVGVHPVFLYFFFVICLVMTCRIGFGRPARSPPPRPGACTGSFFSINLGEVFMVKASMWEPWGFRFDPLGLHPPV